MIALHDLSRFRKQMLAALVDGMLLPLIFCAAIWLRYDGISMFLLQQYQVLIFAALDCSADIYPLGFVSGSDSLHRL